MQVLQAAVLDGITRLIVALDGTAIIITNVCASFSLTKFALSRLKVFRLFPVPYFTATLGRNDYGFYANMADSHV